MSLESCWRSEIKNGAVRVSTLAALCFSLELYRISLLAILFNKLFYTTRVLLRLFVVVNTD